MRDYFSIRSIASVRARHVEFFLTPLQQRVTWQARPSQQQEQRRRTFYILWVQFRAIADQPLQLSGRMALCRPSSLRSVSVMAVTAYPEKSASFTPMQPRHMSWPPICGAAASSCVSQSNLACLFSLPIPSPSRCNPGPAFTSCSEPAHYFPRGSDPLPLSTFVTVSKRAPLVWHCVSSTDRHLKLARAQ